MCTNVHSQGPVDRPGQPPESSALWICPGRPLGQMPSIGRPFGRPLFPTVENPTVGGRPAGRPTAGVPAELDPNDYIFEVYKLGFTWTVLYKILSGF